MKLTDCLCEDFIAVDLKAETGDEVLREMADIITSRFDEPNRDRLLSTLRCREKVGTTAMGNQFAFPHARMAGSRKLIVALAISRKGVDFGALDGKPVRFFITIVTGAKASRKYLQVLASFCSIGRDTVRREKVLAAGSARELCNIIESFNITFEN
ncbi:PTS sugar transporter subunit IIA [Candidatus Hydrogenedentota bacterium]